ncbi:hypothetical protein CBS101457_002133 [Exobasidium rhododendri]|nr:hypothetical protein CBS101457_002133 [Exobasidium rhododendri]
MSSSSPIVLITGITGFLAAHVLDSVLADPAKYRVRGTVRNLGKKEALLARLGAENAARVELVQVSATEKDDLSEAVRGVTYIAHVASPYQLQVEDVERDLLIPAVEGTLNILRYAKKEPSVKKVAITSSFAAVVDFTKGGPNRPGYVYTKENWNPHNREDAKGPVAYAVSKKLADKAAWDFVEKEKPQFEISTFNPPMIYGQTLQPGVTLSSLNTSSKTIYTLISSADAMPDDRLPLFCHASDVGDAHVRWLSSKTASPQRYLLFGGRFNWAMAVQHISETRPDLRERLPKGYEKAILDKKNPNESYATLDCTPAKEELHISFKGWKETLDDSLDSLLSLEKNKDWK